MDTVARRHDLGTRTLHPLLLLLLLCAPARADGAELLEKLGAAQDAGDTPAVVAVLDQLPAAFNAEDDEDLRAEILSEVGWVAMTAEAEAVRVAAIRALGGLRAPDAAWEELSRFLPTADQAAATAAGLAAIRAAGTLAPDAAHLPLLTLAREAVDPRLQAAAVRALGAWKPGREGHDERVQTLLRLVLTLEPGPQADAASRERWNLLEPALSKTLSGLLERGLDATAHLREWQKEHGPLSAPEPPGTATPAPGGVTPPRSGGSTRWPELARRLASEDDEFRLGAVDEVYDRALEGPDVRVALEAVVDASQEWRILSMALRALAHQDTGAPVPAHLLRRAKAREWQVRLALAEGLVAYRHVDAVGALIDLLGDKRLRVRAGAAKSLEALTGESHDISQKAWARWYRKQKGEIRFLPRASRPKHAKEREYAFGHNRFFGTRIRSDRVALVLDKSESMYYGLFDQVVDEVAAFLSAALPTTFFGVIEFDAEPRPWQKRLVPANAGNAEEVIDFLQRAKPTGPTNIIDSLRMALALPDVDSVVLLSDGLPNRGDPQTPNEILEQVRQQNRYARVSIHTLLVERGRKFPHDGPKGDKKPPLDEAEKERRGHVRKVAPDTVLGSFMRSLAEQNEGRFEVVFADWYEPPPDAVFGEGTDK